jgi:hypothetical protein
VENMERNDLEIVIAFDELNGSFGYYMALPKVDNPRIHQQGVNKKITLQKICKLCSNEKQVRSVLDTIAQKPKNAQEILNAVQIKDKSVFQFEENLT